MRPEIGGRGNATPASTRPPRLLGEGEHEYRGQLCRSGGGDPDLGQTGTASVGDQPLVAAGLPAVCAVLGRTAVTVAAVRPRPR
jgi:hypothetical protein